MRRFLGWVLSWFEEDGRPIVFDAMVVASCPNCAKSYVSGHEAGRRSVMESRWKEGYNHARAEFDAEMLQAHAAAADFQESLVEFATLVAVTV